MRVTAVQTPQQSGSGSATSMSLDTTAAVTATAETPTSEPIAGLAAAPTPQPSLVSVPGPLRTQNIPSMPFWRILPDQYRSERFAECQSRERHQQFLPHPHRIGIDTQLCLLAAASMLPRQCRFDADRNACCWGTKLGVHTVPVQTSADA